MKRLLVILFSVVLTVGGALVPANAKKQPVDETKAALVEQMLSKHLYKVNFDRAYPVSFRSFYLNHPYYIAVVGEDLDSYLPYFGRSYGAVPFGLGSWLDFQGPISNYEERTGKKGQHIISFDAHSPDDTNTYMLTVYPSGEADLTVTSINKQSISYSGKLDLEPDFEVISRVTPR